MKTLTLFLLSIFLFGCDQASDKQKDKRIKDCLVDQVVSSIVDPKNLMLYAATADLMLSALVLQKATVVSDCRTIIIGHKNGIETLSMFADDYCPEELMKLSKEQLIKLDDKARKIIRVYNNVINDIADKALGRCVEL